MTLLIYCAGKSARFAEIAVAAGFLYGCRSDHRPTHSVAFADLDWHRPNLPLHLAFVAEHRPHLAVAPDVLDLSVLPETLRYAERLAVHAERVIIVPKVAGVLERLPGEPWLVVGYSVPTRYGGADGFLAAELSGFDVHLLGGSPRQQRAAASYMHAYSADGSVAARAARFGTYYSARRDRWVGGDRQAVPEGPDLPYRAFARSCAEIMAAWSSSPPKRSDSRPDTPGEPF